MNLIRQFIAALGQIGAELGTLAKHVLALRGSVDEQVRATREQIEVGKKDQKANDGMTPSVIEDPNPLPIAVEAETHERKSVGKQIKTAAEILGIAAAIIYAFVSYNQWKEMMHQTDATGIATRQARRDAAKQLWQSQRQMRLDQRPYVLAVYLKPLDLGSDPGRFFVNVYWANYGKSPALHAAGNGFVFTGGDALKQVDKFFAALPLQPPKEQQTFIIAPGTFNPGDPEKTPGGFSSVFTKGLLKKSDLLSLLGKDFHVAAAGRVYYEGVFGDGYYSDWCYSNFSNGKMPQCPTHNEVH